MQKIMLNQIKESILLKVDNLLMEEKIYSSIYWMYISDKRFKFR